MRRFSWLESGPFPPNIATHALGSMMSFGFFWNSLLLYARPLIPLDASTSKLPLFNLPESILLTCRYHEMSFLKHLWGDLEVQISILTLYCSASFSGLKLTPKSSCLFILVLY
ncbi:hypothetical protein CFP56_002550 [Quercus suber]|uniref:Uncharacterized protein n=1 Tax=Quercus suber TaxID=58331 RepID=A0AAW0LDS4_QUESU